MKTEILQAVTLALAVILTSAPSLAEDYYYSLDTSWAVSPSDQRIAVQFDTTSPPPPESTFFANHPTLDDTIPVQPLGRRFSVYGIDPAFGFDTAAAELAADSQVNRCIPVYITLCDSSEFCVTDLVDVLFDKTLPHDSAHALLAAHGLTFVDSNQYSHNLWKAALHDSIKSSPLSYANALHEEQAVTWAAPATYSRVVTHSAPTDEFYIKQWYLEQTGQYGWTIDTDIDAEGAWQFTLLDSTILVAVLDKGFEDHEDLSSSRWVAPKHYFVWRQTPADPWVLYEDNDPTPWETRHNHGMACAGILAATHNEIGIAGVNGSCLVIPLRIFADPPYQDEVNSDSVAEAIRYAYEHQQAIIMKGGRQ